ncbi:MAG TPA: class I SAM-dependent methyltransferase [Streptosporangiaceae bacterium]|jgi:SAM-dependent methyltransferase
MTGGPRAGDAFGEMLLAELAIMQAGGGRSVTEIVERDDGFIRAASAARYFAHPDEWAPFERRTLDLAAGRVIDIGCGAGRFALALQERGIAVTALDISPGAVEVSRRRGVRDVVLASAQEGAVGRGAYDTLLLMGENLGLIGGRGRAAAFLAGLAAAATPTARIIGHGADPHQTRDPVHVRYRERNHGADAMDGQMTIRVRYRDLATAWFPYLLCSPSELAGLVAGTQWELTDVEHVDQVNYLAILTRGP